MNENDSEERARGHVRKLIWLYFWLLLLEGALRKWVLPDYSTPLLVIRDPLALAIYFMSFRARVFPWNAWVVVLVVLGCIDTMTTFYQLWGYVSPLHITAVTIYGIHSNFFHLPLVFVIGRVLTFEDVRRIGWWTLVLIVPMTVLMVMQFRAPADSFINRAAGGEGEVLMSSMDKVRTAGPFSFVIGVVAYFSMATGYLVWGLLTRGVYPRWLLAIGGAALIIGISVSGSRSVVGACGVVVASLLLVLILRPKIINRFGQVLLAVVVLGFVVSRTPIFREGAKVLSTRFSEVAEATEQSIPVDLLSRSVSTFYDAWKVIGVAPALGWGLGVGTNAGAKLLVGQSGFLLMEGEWPRIIMENGPVLGLAYLLWRFAFVLRIAWLTIKSVLLGNLLPLLLFASSGLPLLNGQFGQPTILGFAVFVTGLAVAATGGNVIVSGGEPPPDDKPKVSLKPVRGRSTYAERLHGAGVTPKPTNGSVAG
ncbi:MAG TPA: hypothetical protein VJ719_14455 [Chthoniobacterales bacterium]|nr:hypothetical protein [Chthoniobacterales bacterium]